ncbi:cysteine hydrolase family protein [Alteribacter natronophilus]|uniref:cysteine hydrolase family protein n=1 Tax=Alteribacter natronophilus TaxID=2583810 RepID=UPI00110F013B|nr:isochorismatase family cysteine hydrolase [Alteribacter natronophilus]TMW73547.1 cysteine hydrolase [Alteribacter natronophilus]
MKALIVVDYTYDFIAEDGRLTCGEPGRQIEERVALLAETFWDKGHYVIFAVDVHEENDPFHPETALFPPHNVRGTKGRALFGSAGIVYERLARQDQDRLYWLDKTRYSAFAGTNLEIKLRERGITELHLAGVCTDICILHTAIDAFNRGFSVTIHQDAVQSFSKTGHEWALNHFENVLGANVTASYDVPSVD